MTNYDTYSLSKVKIDTITSSKDGKEKHDVKEISGKTRCFLFDFSKKHETPIINIVKVFNNDEETVFEFEIGNDNNEVIENDKNITLSRKVDYDDGYYKIVIEAVKEEKLF